jgi:hypothetical protein
MYVGTDGGYPQVRYDYPMTHLNIRSVHHCQRGLDLGGRRRDQDIWFTFEENPIANCSIAIAAQALFSSFRFRPRQSCNLPERE